MRRDETRKEQRPNNTVLVGYRQHLHSYPKNKGAIERFKLKDTGQDGGGAGLQKVPFAFDTQDELEEAKVGEGRPIRRLR